MGLRFSSDDETGTPIEWRLERGGRLFNRKHGEQRWTLITKDVLSPEDARAFILQYHEEDN